MPIFEYFLNIREFDQPSWLNLDFFLKFWQILMKICMKNYEIFDPKIAKLQKMHQEMTKMPIKIRFNKLDSSVETKIDESKL